MRLKLAISGIMAAILLLTACAASACEIRCDIRSAQPSCHGSQTATSDDAMPGMAGMSPPAAEYAFGASPCADHVCTQQLASLWDTSCTQHISDSAVAAATTLNFGLAAPFGIRTNLATETPPPIRLSPVILHTTLRV